MSISNLNNGESVSYLPYTNVRNKEIVKVLGQEAIPFVPDEYAIYNYEYTFTLNGLGVTCFKNFIIFLANLYTANNIEYTLTLSDEFIRNLNKFNNEEVFKNAFKTLYIRFYTRHSPLPETKITNEKIAYACLNEFKLLYFMFALDRTCYYEDICEFDRILEANMYANDGRKFNNIRDIVIKLKNKFPTQIYLDKYYSELLDALVALR